VRVVWSIGGHIHADRRLLPPTHSPGKALQRRRRASTTRPGSAATLGLAASLARRLREGSAIARVLDRVTHSTHGIGLFYKKRNCVPMAFVFTRFSPIITGLWSITSTRNNEFDFAVPPLTGIFPLNGAHVARTETYFLLAAHHRDDLPVERDSLAQVAVCFHEHAAPTLRIAGRPVCSVFLAGARVVESGRRVKAGEATAQRRPEGGLEATAASWTVGSEKDGSV
jgi:hypothetical protein